MPYFVYKVFPGKRLELVQPQDKYPQAKELATSMRKALRPEDNFSVKIMFARNPEEAERLLTEEREPRPIGEE